MRPSQIRFEFVEFVPNELQPETLYVSMTYGTVVHSCLCGCGSRIVTPLSPTDWRMTYDGESISLSPSVGNWSFACQSHYWIHRNMVTWAKRMSPEKIEAGRERDRLVKQAYYSEASVGRPNRVETPPTRPVRTTGLQRLLRRNAD